MKVFRQTTPKGVVVKGKIYTELDKGFVSILIKNALSLFPSVVLLESEHIEHAREVQEFLESLFPESVVICKKGLLDEKDCVIFPVSLERNYHLYTLYTQLIFLTNAKIEINDPIKIYIGIDCSPGTPRPDTYLSVPSKMLNVTSYETHDRLFGAWTWEFTCSKALYDSKQEELRKYFEDLNKSGKIRGAEWGKYKEV